MTTPEALRIRYSDPVDPWEMLDTPWGHMPAWKAATYATGTTEAAMRAYEQVRNDSASIVARHDAREAALNARQDSLDARERQLAVNTTQFVDFVGKASVLFHKIQKARADAEEEPLPLPPGHKSEEPEPTLNEEASDASLPGDPSPPAATQSAPLMGKDPGDPRGDFPRLNRAITREQTEFPDPELPKPPVQQQPVAAGLDEE